MKLAWHHNKFLLDQKRPDTYCAPMTRMSSTNLNDAKKECTTNPSCHVFYDSKGAGGKFYACDNTTTIKNSTVGSILYQVPLGNKMYMQSNHLRDRF